MTTHTDHQLAHRVQSAGEYRVLSSGYWHAYLLAISEGDEQAKDRHVEQWRKNARLSEQADAGLLRYMDALNLVQAISPHFKATIVENGGVKIADLNTGKEID